MKKLQIGLLLLFAVLLSCKKTKVLEEPSPVIIPTETVNVVKPTDPTVGKTQGFFLEDWAPKFFVTPPYDIVNQTKASVNTTVVIDGNTVLTKVSKYIFGTNTNPYTGQMVSEPLLIDHLTKLSPNLVRFPGGNISSIYFWNSAINMAPNDAPLKLLNADGVSAPAGYWFGKNTESWTLSVDNYYAMLQQTQSTGIITVNYGYARYGTSADPVAAAAHLAAEWVRYDNGRTKYWEIGNESGGAWQAGYRIDLSQNKDGQPELITGLLYGKHFKVFVDSMKNAAKKIGKTIYIGAQILGELPASWSTATDKTWNKDVFAQAGNAADYYIVHSYYTPYNTNSNATDILASAIDVTKSIAEYSTQSMQANGTAVKPIALTEWNIFAVGSKQMVSNVAGMHADMVLGEFLKNQLSMAARWDIANGYDSGNDHGMFGLGDEGNGTAKWNPRPVFYHMYYFQKYFGDRMLASSVTGNSDIVSYAFSYSSGEVGAVLVNKGNSFKTVKIETKNFNKGDRYYWHTLSGGTDNGDFSAKVYVNAIGPASATGGPSNYAEIKAYSVTAQGEIKLDIPARASVYLVVDKK